MSKNEMGARKARLGDVVAPQRGKRSFASATTPLVRQVRGHDHQFSEGEYVSLNNH